MRYTLIPTLLMSLSHAVTATPNNNSLINFELQPKICIAKEVGDACLMKIKLKWQASTPMSLCLAQNQTRLKCWQQEIAINEHIAIEVKQQSEFTLFDQDSMELIAKQQVIINYQVSKRYRRRLRSEWSIF